LMLHFWPACGKCNGITGGLPHTLPRRLPWPLQRVGCFSIVCDDPAEAKAVESQMKVGLTVMGSQGRVGWV